jgi:hypothetical protein
MAKANKSVFKELVETTEYKYITKSGKEHVFEITQLTVGDIADITAIEDESKGDYVLIARSLGKELDEVYDIPIPAVKGLVETIVEFNELGDIYEE